MRPSVPVVSLNQGYRKGSGGKGSQIGKVTENVTTSDIPLNKQIVILERGTLLP